MKSTHKLIDHLSTHSYDKDTIVRIFYWLYGRGIINRPEFFIDHLRVPSSGISYTFDFFKEWYDSEPETKSSAICIGDYVKVMTDDNTRSEYVEFAGLDDNGILSYGLSDGTWAKAADCAKYKLQGAKRRNVQKLLDTTI